MGPQSRARDATSTPLCPFCLLSGDPFTDTGCGARFIHTLRCGKCPFDGAIPPSQAIKPAKRAKRAAQQFPFFFLSSLFPLNCIHSFLSRTSSRKGLWGGGETARDDSALGFFCFTGCISRLPISSGLSTIIGSDIPRPHVSTTNPIYDLTNITITTQTPHNST
ncbi:hypothetical protein BD289DRAFT_224482 [Coniella lustricola]|uniref:Uncharacterized protein n=1 Tax=Coniella lustricola TaxID=2025994 RepID=A0A2T2ZS09_9PEZI|nr:hypothetical protein BD289DRAFT_224482 [Coniella lustricola]